MEIRRGRSGEIEKLIEVYQSGYSSMKRYAYHSPERIKEYLLWLREGDKNGFFVAQEGTQLIGFASIHTQWWDRKEGKTAELHEIVVKAEYQGKGVGKSLFEKAKDYALSEGRDKITLWVGEKNSRAREWYKKLGFEEIGKSGEWIRMKLDLFK
ncbi:GNAT family N-acetyltransferase [Candidatus Calescamantes bacterium]|nr:GNAT family N-acetyltransferase [Candidatus Calescamantes bacterium]